MEMTFVKTTSENLNSIPLSNGQMIVDTTINRRYLDFSNVRQGIASSDEIDVMTDVNGCCNILPNNANTTTTHGNVTFTVNDDGSITANGSTTGSVRYVILIQELSLKAGTYVVSSGLPNINYGLSVAINHVEIAVTVNDKGMTTFTLNSDSIVSVAAVVGLNTTVNNETIYPMLYDARLKPTGYVQYSMTNKQLTDAVNRGSVSVVADGVKSYSTLLNEIYSLIDISKITIDSKMTFDGAVYALNGNSSSGIVYTNVQYVSSMALHATLLRLRSNDSHIYGTHTTASGTTITDIDSLAMTAGLSMYLYY